MKRGSKVHTDRSHLVRSYPLRLELLEDRLPPGDLVGSGLLGASGTQARRASEGSPSLAGPSGLWEACPPAHAGVGRSSWAAWEGNARSEVTAGPRDDLLRATRNSRPTLHVPSQAEEQSAGFGPASRLAEAGLRTGSLPSGMTGAATGSVVIAPSDTLEGQARALTQFVQQLPASLDAGAPAQFRGETGPGPNGEFRVVATNPSSNGLARPVTTQVAVEFSEPVDATTLGPATFAVFGRVSGMAQGSFQVSKDGHTVVFTPARPFLRGEAVEVLLTHDLAATDGGRLRDAGYAWTFWVKAGRSSNEFVERGRLDTGTNVRSYGATPTDLNGDGWVDLAVVNEVSADLRVLMNNGNGTFAAPVRYPIRPGASPTAVGDFNRDGFTDIASSNYDDNSMSVLLGRGDGTFQASQTYAVGTTPAGIAALDVNGDGAVELVVTNSISNNLSLFRNNGDGTFQPQSTFFSVPGARLYGLAAADMNNDGIMDLVVGARATRRVYVLLGNGSGGFTQSANQDAGGDPWVLRAADVSGDGRADVQIANNSVGNLAVVLGNGTGGLAPPVTYAAGSHSVSVSLGDLNGDGSLDLVVSNFGSRNYMVYTNNGAGQFTRIRTLTARQSGSCTTLFDYNGDGVLDIGGVDELEDEIILFMTVQASDDRIGDD